MARTTISKLRRNFAALRRRARREPVGITRYGRRELILMSANHYDWLLATSRRAFRTKEAAPIVVDAVWRAAWNAG